MVKLMILIVLVAVLCVTVQAGINGECPSSGQHTQCSPKCISDHECAQTGGKCCSNICNYKSCVIPKPGNTGSNSGYKGSTGSDVYCNNVKCRPFEKCGMDRNSKRMACIRT